jgi:hypothetical protein
LTASKDLRAASTCMNIVLQRRDVHTAFSLNPYLLGHNKELCINSTFPVFTPYALLNKPCKKKL